jgi:hypothetical protein
LSYHYEEDELREEYPSSYPIKEKIRKATKITTKRRFKPIKKNPRRIRSIIVEDKGKILETTTITYPLNVQMKRTKHSKKKNDNLLVFHVGNLKLTWRIDIKKGAFFDFNGIYLGSFEKHDLKRLFSISSRLLRLEKRKAPQKLRKILKITPKKKSLTKITPKNA